MSGLAELPLWTPHSCVQAVAPLRYIIVGAFHFQGSRQCHDIVSVLMPCLHTASTLIHNSVTALHNHNCSYLPTAGPRLGRVAGPVPGLVAAQAGNRDWGLTRGAGQGHPLPLGAAGLPGPGRPRPGLQLLLDPVVAGGGAGVAGQPAGEREAAGLATGRAVPGVAAVWRPAVDYSLQGSRLTSITRANIQQ